MALISPMNLQNWIQEHRDRLQPPVGNVAFHEGDFLVMVVGGPNARTDFHINPREEVFFQVQGDIVLRVLDREHGGIRDIPIRQGELFVLPPRVPHSPQRPADTVGLVIEMPRMSSDDHLLVWYCSACAEIVHQVNFQPVDIGKQIRAALTEFDADETLRTCAKCGVVHPTRQKS